MKSFDPHQRPAEGKQESIYPDAQQTNTTDGGEFLDDNIRTTEEPFGETEKTTV